MNKPAQNLAQYALLIALLARVAVPAGFMPADTSSGWFLELCPEGLTPPAMLALLGDSGGHHHHTSAGYLDLTDAPNAPEYDGNCLLSGFAMAALPAGGFGLSASLAIGELIVVPPRRAWLQSQVGVYRSRAPPRT